MRHHPARDLSRTCRCVSILLGRAALRADQHVHLLFPPVMRVQCANRTDSSTQHQRYHLLSAAGLNSSRNRNFVHMKGERGGVVGPAFSGGTRQNSTRLLYRSYIEILKAEVGLATTAGCPTHGAAKMTEDL